MFQQDKSKKTSLGRPKWWITLNSWLFSKYVGEISEICDQSSRCVNIPQSAVEWGMIWADWAHPRSLPRHPPARHGKFPRHPHPPHHRQFPAHQKQNRALFEPSPEDKMWRHIVFAIAERTSTNLDRFRRIPHVCIQFLKTVGPFSFQLPEFLWCLMCINMWDGVAWWTTRL